MRDNLRAVRLRVGRNVRQLRRLRGLSQEGLAEVVGNTHKHIGQVERGEVNVTIDILTRIAAGLSVHVGDLFASQSAGASRPRVYVLTDRELDQVDRAADALDLVRSVRPRSKRPRG
jgi:transcriptional regulator with XRE-family HTH domain